ncbi:ubiquitin-conjugating enzyme E2 J1, putative [Entamoeba invadens IP1]|uniref:Ubiquitin-conjugating enzyme E2 J1, putative n=1 Tax=Entamoeba invadens IP1 TaxID=370355 RepID=A0A0A1U6M6_ENTIV|nr:ubiquitin-conjugating enzyme E2 J1, putative [Entamoeba invadens IP1]ELP90052.1 ubiquitin-conjugating enzyme E2 J1, putative [Entamoeba invadens IP1]|eukprot:XP_004256823.1 ubiquitin-conjugating enzyme E2 J1, putative [Entamoeba invadens IP1]
MSTQTNEANVAKRLQREYNHFFKNAPNDISIHLVESSVFECHFSFKGSPDTEFAEGIYHGKFIFPYDYPKNPPEVYFLTPSGRFVVNQKICLSMTSFHPETWTPTWTISSMLEAIRAFMSTPASGAVGAIDAPIEVRKQHAKNSLMFECPVCGAKHSELKLIYAAAKKCEDDKKGAKEKEESPSQDATKEQMKQVELNTPSSLEISPAIFIDEPLKEKTPETLEGAKVVSPHVETQQKSDRIELDTVPKPTSNTFKLTDSISGDFGKEISNEKEANLHIESLKEETLNLLEGVKKENDKTQTLEATISPRPVFKSQIDDTVNDDQTTPREKEGDSDSIESEEHDSSEPKESDDFEDPMLLLKKRQEEERLKMQRIIENSEKVETEENEDEKKQIVDETVNILFALSAFLIVLVILNYVKVQVIVNLMN